MKRYFLPIIAVAVSASQLAPCAENADNFRPMLCVIGPTVPFQFRNHGGNRYVYTHDTFAATFHVGLYRGNQGEIVAVGIEGWR